MNATTWKIWVDTGGTFTDCIAVDPTGQSRRLKVLSSGILRVKIISASGNKIQIELPPIFSKNFLNGFVLKVGSETRTITAFRPSLSEITTNKAFNSISENASAEITTNEEVPVFAARLLTETCLNEDFPSIEIKLGSTRGTNAILERKGSKTAFLVTKGFKDLILIGNQQRPDLFTLNIVKEPPLYHYVIEVDERIESDGTVLYPLKDQEIIRILNVLKNRKVETVAIAFLNSYKNPAHEVVLAGEIRRSGIGYVSLSHELSSQIKILPRAETTIVNSYL
jgi:5-oxoprolinase (ATP-hydrolysing)